MKQVSCTLLFIVFLQALGVAQSARDSVLKTVHQLFEGMQKADTSLLKNCFAENAVLQTIQEKNSITKVKDESITNFIAFIGKESPGAADEQIIVESVMINGPLASVWTPYKFYYKGKFSHCGINSFQLVRIGHQWKIQYLIDTRRKNGCE